MAAELASDKALLIQAGNYDFKSSLKINNYIDTIDKVSVWRLGKIKDIKGDQLLIRFDGWSEKHNEWKKNWATTSIAPVRSKTCGYTGSKNCAFRDFIYSIDDVNKNCEILDSLIGSNLTFISDPFELTQFIRAKLFVLIDSVLTLYGINTTSINPLPKAASPGQAEAKFDLPGGSRSETEIGKELTANRKLCERLIKLICWYLSNFSSLQSYYYEAINAKNIIYVSLKHAIAAIYPELVEMLRLLLGIVSRSEETRMHCLRLKWDFVKENFFTFVENKGFEQVVVLLKAKQDGLKASSAVLPEYLSTLSFNLDIIHVLTTALIQFHEQDENYTNKIGTDILNELISRIKSLSENDLKELEFSGIEKLFDIFNQLSAISSIFHGKEEISSHSIILRISAQLLACSYIKKKLLGMNIIYQIIPRTILGGGINIKAAQPRPLEWNNSKQLIHAIYSEKILETILQEASHPELIKKCQEIFIYLLDHESKDKFEFKYIQYLWQCAKGKFEQVSRAAYDILVFLAPRLKKKHTKELFKLILEIPVESYTEIILQFMQKYTIAILKEVIRFEPLFTAINKYHYFMQEPLQISSLGVVSNTVSPSPAVQSSARAGKVPLYTNDEEPAEKIISLDLFWNAACCDKLPCKLRDLSISILAGLIHNVKEGIFLKEYLAKAIEIISNNGPNIARCCQFFLEAKVEIFKLLQDKKCSELEEKYHVLKNVLKDCEEYHKGIAKMAVGESSGSGSRSVLSNYLSQSGFPFMKQSQIYIDFIFSYLRARELHINSEIIDKLWNYYIIHGINGSHKDILFTKFKDSLELGINNSCLDNKTIRTFFEEYLCGKLPTFLTPLSHSAFQCFTSFLDKYNAPNFEIQSYSERFRGEVGINNYSYRFNLLRFVLGLPCLFKVIFAASQTDFEKEAITYLVESVICNMIKSREFLRQEILCSSLDMCLSLIIDNNNISAKMGMKIISTLIEEIECQKVEEIDDSYVATPCLEFVICKKPNNELYRIALNENLRIVHLRNYLSWQFGVDKKLLQLKYRSDQSAYGFSNNIKNELDTRKDQEYLAHLHKYLNGNEIFCSILPLGLSPEETPRSIIANTALFDKLKKLLEVKDEEVVNIVWKLIAKLPINEKYKTRIMEIDQSKKVVDWEELLEVSIEKSPYTVLTYNFFVIVKQLQYEWEPYNTNKPSTSKPVIGPFMNILQKYSGVEFLMTAFEKRGKSIIQEKPQNVSMNAIMMLTYLIECLRGVLIYAGFVPSLRSLVPILNIPGYDVKLWDDIANLMKYLSQNISTKEHFRKLQVVFFMKCCDLHCKLIKLKPQFLELFIQDKYCNDIMKPFLLIPEGEEIKSDEEINFPKKVSRHIMNVVCLLQAEKVKDDEINLLKLLKEKVMTLVMQYVSIALLSEEVKKISNTIYDICSSLITLALNEDCVILLESAPDIIKKITDGIIKRINTKRSEAKSIQQANTTDNLLAGLMDILYKFLLKAPAIVIKQISNPITLVDSLVISLFHFNESNNLPLCITRYNREKALKLLETLILNIPATHNQFFEFISKIHLAGNWRTSKKSDWSIKALGEWEKSNLYVGLKNLGATCYMNSLVQQLFMNESFRNGLIKCPMSESNLTPAISESPILKGASKKVPLESDANKIMREMQILFKALKESQRPYYNPKSFALSLQDPLHRINLKEQKDVDEYLLTLFDKIDLYLMQYPQSSHSNLLKNSYQLTLAHEILCRDSPHRSEHTEITYSLILSIKNKRSIFEGLQSYVDSETLEGDNAYSCEQCGQKVSASKRQNIKYLPNNLIIVLKRFEFNLESQSKIKINDYCEFPMEINMEEYTQEGIMRKDLMSAIDKGKYSVEELSEEQKRLLKHNSYDSYYHYKLKGVIIHSGHADGGHYYSYIQDRKTNSWYEFNDVRVRPFDINNLPEEAFGGEDESASIQGVKMHKEMRTRSRNAYMLFYERDGQFNMDKIERVKDEEWIIGASGGDEAVKAQYQKCILEINPEEEKITKPQAVDTPHQIIQMDNKKYWLTQLLFDPAYLNMIYKLLHSIMLQGDSMKSYSLARDTKTALQGIHKFCVTFFLTSSLRSNNKEQAGRFAQAIKDLCRKNLSVAVNFLEVMNSKAMLDEFYKFNPNNESKKWLTGVLMTCINFVYQFEKDIINNKLLPSSSNANQKELLYSVEAMSKALNSSNATVAGMPSRDESTFMESTDETSLTTKAEAAESQGNVICFAGALPKSVPITWAFINTLLQELPNFNELPYLTNLYRIISCYARQSNETVVLLSYSAVFGVALEQLLFDRGANWEKINQKLVHLKIIKRQESDSSSELSLLSQQINPSLTKKEPLASTITPTYEAHNYIFVLELIYYLLYGLGRVKQKEDKSYTAYLSSTEIEYLKLLCCSASKSHPAKEVKIWDKIIAKISNSKAAVTYFAKILALISYQNQDITQTLLSYVIQKMSSEECNALRPYLRINTHFMLNMDNFFVSRADNFYNNLFIVFDAAKKFYRIAESLIDYFIKLCRKHKVFYEHLSKTPNTDKKKIYEMLNWIKENSVPTPKFKGNIFRTRTDLKMTEDLTKALEPDYKIATDGRYANLKTIINKSSYSLSPDYDSDDDFYTSQNKIQENQIYDIYIANKGAWIQAKALTVTDELAQFECTMNEDKYKIWIEIESDRIAPKDAMCNDIRRQQIIVFILQNTNA